MAPASPRTIAHHLRRRAVVGAVLALTVTLAGCSVGPPAQPGATPSSPSGQPATTDESTTSAPVIPYFNSSLTPPISLSMPSWTAHASADGSFGSVIFTEADCAGLGGQFPCAADQDLKLRVLSVTFFYAKEGVVNFTRNPSYADYVTHLDALATSGVARTVDRAPVRVGGRSAVVMSLSVLHDAPGALACAFESDPAGDCASLVAGRAARMAVVDQGAGVPPTVLYLSLNGDAPDRDERFTELDTMLSTVTFG
jgi:hypothetical protein